MVRFARADGSKGSNKRVVEEPTPWQVFASPQPSNKKKIIAESVESIEKEKQTESSNSVQQPLASPKLIESPVATGICQDVTSPKDNKVKTKRKRLLEKAEKEVISEAPEIKKKRHDAEEVTSENLPSQNDGEENSNENGNPEDQEKSKKRRKKAKTQDDVVEKKEYKINEKGQRVKVHKDGTERTWFDLPYTESERMTRYDNMWVKKDMVEKLDEMKQTLKTSGAEQNEIMKKMMKAKRKAHRELRIELIYEQKRAVQHELGVTETKEKSKNNMEKGKKKKKEKKEQMNKGKENNEETETKRTDKNQEQLNKNKVREYQVHKMPDGNELEVECFKCKQQGHRASKCPLRKLKRKQKLNVGARALLHAKLKCFKCNQEGHRVVDCTGKAYDQKEEYSNRNYTSEESGMHSTWNQGRNSRNGSEFNITCFKCNQQGHRAMDCPSSVSHGSQQGITCFNCNKEGHRKADCPEYGSQDWGRGTGFQNESRITCFKCNQQGHRMSDCPNMDGGFKDGSQDLDKSSGYQNESRITCFKCNQQGHRMVDCPGLDKQPDSNITCFKCNQQGHRMSDCPNSYNKSNYSDNDFKDSGNQDLGRGAGFQNESRTTCFKCNQQGHRMADCPGFEKRNDSNVTCFKCNQQGHRMSDCPNMDGGFKDGSQDLDKSSGYQNESRITCFKCNQQGHRMAECPGLDKQTDSNITCFKCNQQGHRMSDCPNSYNKSNYSDNDFKDLGNQDTVRGPGLQTESRITCFKCNEQGHRMADCPKLEKQNESNVTCFRCSQQGHRMSDCPNSYDKSKSSDLTFEENEFMTQYEGFWVKRSMVSYLEDKKEAKKQEIIDARCNGNSSKELTENEAIELQRAVKKLKRLQNNLLKNELRENRAQIGSSAISADNGSSSEPDVVEFDGYWVYKKSADKLHKLQAQLIRDGVSEEQRKAIILKERRKEEKVLKNDRSSVCLKCCQPGHIVSACPNFITGAVAKSQAENTDVVQSKTVATMSSSSEMKTKTEIHSSGSTENRNKAESDDVVKFDGFWVKKESADRLYKLKDRLTREGISQKDIGVIMQTERRKEEKMLKNERNLVCLRCREAGHMVSACPKILQQTGGDGHTDICYTCGSTEHKYTECTSKKKGSEFAHATCYICGEVGHIARECSDNPRGLYPKGGACRECGSVEHLRKDCPTVQVENEKASLTVGRMNANALEAIDDFGIQTSVNAGKKKSLKVVTF